MKPNGRSRPGPASPAASLGVTTRQARACFGRPHVPTRRPLPPAGFGALRHGPEACAEWCADVSSPNRQARTVRGGSWAVPLSGGVRIAIDARGKLEADRVRMMSAFAWCVSHEQLDSRARRAHRTVSRWSSTSATAEWVSCILGHDATLSSASLALKVLQTRILQDEAFLNASIARPGCGPGLSIPAWSRSTSRASRNGFPFLAMRFIDGGTLEARLQERPGAPRRCAVILRHIAAPLTSPIPKV